MQQRKTNGSKPDPIKKDHYEVVIIGAGIGGMACAFHLAEKGKEVLLLEKNLLPMGSAWAKRVGDYAFEETIHFMPSMDADGPSGRFLEALARHEPVETVQLHDLYRLKGRDFDIRLNEDVEGFRQSLLEISQRDARFVNRLVDGCTHFAQHMTWPRYPQRWMSITERLKLIWPFRGQLLSMLSFNRTRFFDGIDKWVRDPRLKNVLYTTLHGSDLSFMAVLAILGSAFSASGGLPVEGTHVLFETVARVLTDLGVTLATQRAVERIQVEGGRAVGVTLQSGQQIRANQVVSAMDRGATYNRLLADEPLVQREQARFARYPIGYSFNTVCVGAALPTSMEQIGAHHLRYNTQSQPIHDQQQREEDKVLSIRFCHFANPDAAPAGHSALVLSTMAHYDDWAHFKRADGRYDGDAYEARKEEIARLMIARASEALPGLAGSVVQWDMSTPLTIEKWTAATRGVGSGGYYAVPGMITRFLSEESRLAGLYFAGQFATGRPGICGSLQSGLNTAALILGDKQMLRER